MQTQLCQLNSSVRESQQTSKYTIDFKKLNVIQAAVWKLVCINMRNSPKKIWEETTVKYFLYLSSITWNHNIDLQGGPCSMVISKLSVFRKIIDWSPDVLHRKHKKMKLTCSNTVYFLQPFNFLSLHLLYIHISDLPNQKSLLQKKSTKTLCGNTTEKQHAYRTPNA